LKNKALVTISLLVSYMVSKKIYGLCYTGSIYLSRRCVQALFLLFFTSATSAGKVAGPLGTSWCGTLENTQNETRPLFGLVW